MDVLIDGPSTIAAGHFEHPSSGQTRRAPEKIKAGRGSSLSFRGRGGRKLGGSTIGSICILLLPPPIQVVLGKTLLFKGGHALLDCRTTININFDAMVYCKPGAFLRLDIILRL